MVDLRYVLIRRKREKVLSAVADVAGTTSSSRNRVNSVGNIARADLLRPL